MIRAFFQKWTNRGENRSHSEHMQENQFDKHQNDWNGWVFSSCYEDFGCTVNRQLSFFALELNGGIWAAVGCEVRGEEVERKLQMGHQRLGVEGSGGFQTEAQVLLYESLWEVQSQGSETMEIDAANIENCNHYYTGRWAYRSRSVQSVAVCLLLIFLILQSVSVFRAEQRNDGHIQRGKSDDVQTSVPQRIQGSLAGKLCTLH